MIKINELTKLENGKYCCDLCKKTFSEKGISTHIWRKHTNEGIEHNKKMFGIKRTAWNKGLSKDVDSRVNKMATTIINKYKTGELVPHMKNKKHSIESIELMKMKCGGYRRGSGRGISGWYKNYWCDSTYELCWLIYQLDNGKTPIRNNKCYEYLYNGKKYKYYPDFILDDLIYEIKGYETIKDIEKYKSITTNNLIILKKNDLIPIFEYIKIKYNVNNFYELYDSSGKKINENELCVCGNKKYHKSKLCNVCDKKTTKRLLNNRKTIRPTYEQLLLDICDVGYCGTGRKYGVSDNSIRKWIKFYEKYK